MLPPKLRELVLACGSDVAAFVNDFARRRHVERAEDVEQSRLPATGRAKQHHQLAFVERYGHASKGVHVDVAHAVGLRDVVCREDGGALGVWVRL